MHRRRFPGPGLRVRARETAALRCTRSSPVVQGEDSLRSHVVSPAIANTRYAAARRDGAFEPAPARAVSTSPCRTNSPCALAISYAMRRIAERDLRGAHNSSPCFRRQRSSIKSSALTEVCKLTFIASSPLLSRMQPTPHAILSAGGLLAPSLLGTGLLSLLTLSFDTSGGHLL